MSRRSRPVTCLPLPSSFSIPLPLWCPHSFGFLWSGVLFPTSSLFFLCFCLCVSILLFSFSSLTTSLSAVGPPLPTPPHDLPFLLTGLSLGPCPSHPPSTSCVVSHVASQAAKLPMSIIIIGVGQAEFDGESPPPPTCFPRAFRPLGVTPPKGGRTHPSLCETDCLGEQAGCESVLVCTGKGVSRCVPHAHTPRLWGGGPKSLLQPPPWESAGGWGGGRGGVPGTGLLLSPGFSLLISEVGGLGRQPLSCQAQVPSS